MKRPFTIAHISDLHVLDLAGVGPQRYLNKRLTGLATLRMKRKHVHRAAYVRAIAREIRAFGADHVAITGDMTNLALEPEFAACKDLLTGALGLDPRDVSVVPGNHDVYTRGASRTRRFEAYFREFLESDLPDLAADLGVGRFPVVKLRGPVAIIGLSSAVPRPPLVAAGRLGDAQLDALGRVLEHPEVRSRTPVILLHHPAHNPVSRLKTLVEGLHDAPRLLAKLEGITRGLLLHGHLHRRQQQAHTTRAGTLHAVGATSASLHHDDDAKMAGFNVYELDASGHIATIAARVFDPARETFRDTEVPQARAW